MAPIISITSPTNQASFTADSTITITATASDADGQISKVEFFDGATKLGEALHCALQFCMDSCACGSLLPNSNSDRQSRRP